MEKLKEKIKKQLELEKEILELVTEEKLKAFLKGELVGLESALREWEEENAN